MREIRTTNAGALPVGVPAGTLFYGVGTNPSRLERVIDVAHVGTATVKVLSIHKKTGKPYERQLLLHDPVRWYETDAEVAS